LNRSFVVTISCIQLVNNSGVVGSRWYNSDFTFALKADLPSVNLESSDLDPKTPPCNLDPRTPRCRPARWMPRNPN